MELLDDHYDTVMPSSSTAKRHGRKIGRVNIPLSELRPGEKVDKSFKLDRVDDSENRAIRSKHYGQDMLSEMWYLEQVQFAIFHRFYIPLAIHRGRDVEIDINIHASRRFAIRKALS